MSQHQGMKCFTTFGSQSRLGDIITTPISLESSSPLPPAPCSCQLCPPKPFLSIGPVLQVPAVTGNAELRAAVLYFTAWKGFDASLTKGEKSSE